MGRASGANVSLALVDWVEKGAAPDDIVISSRDNSVSYPICVYPKKTTWGDGSAKMAASDGRARNPVRRSERDVQLLPDGVSVTSWLLQYSSLPPMSSSRFLMRMLSLCRAGDGGAQCLHEHACRAIGFRKANFAAMIAVSAHHPWLAPARRQSQVAPRHRPC